MKCKQCGQDFENIGVLRKHQRADHEDINKKFEVPEVEVTETVVEPFVIPKGAVDEFKYLSNNQPARILCLGHMEDRGFVVDEMTYHF